MKITIETKIEKEIDVEFPLFKVSKYGGTYFKITSPKDAIKVSVGESQMTIDCDVTYNGVITNIIAGTLSSSYEDCSETEFNQAYNIAVKYFLEYATSFPDANAVTLAEQYANNSAA